jgi:hypothetical protein
MATTWSLRQFATASSDNVQPAETESVAEVLEVGDFRIDIRRHKAMLRGEPLALTSEEFDVLVFLTSNPQRVVTPNTTLATHWTGAGTQQTQFLFCLFGRSLNSLHWGSNTSGLNPGLSIVLTRSLHGVGKRRSANTSRLWKFLRIFTNFLCTL